MEERLFRELEQIVSENDSGENILIVTHRGSLRALLTALSDADKIEHKTYSVGTGSMTPYSFNKTDFERISEESN